MNEAKLRKLLDETYKAEGRGVTDVKVDTAVFRDVLLTALQAKNYADLAGPALLQKADQTAQKIADKNPPAPK